MSARNKKRLNTARETYNENLEFALTKSRTKTNNYLRRDSKTRFREKRKKSFLTFLLQFFKKHRKFVTIYGPHLLLKKAKNKKYRLNQLVGLTHGNITLLENNPKKFKKKGM